LKTVKDASPSGVRIPDSPQENSYNF
jgi:hypothetical protein